MGNALVQFNSGEQIIGTMNVAEAIETDSDIVFNESYIVIGNVLRGDSIHATYDLSVVGNLIARKITINGDLIVKGDIEADSLECRGAVICAGEVRVKNANFESYSCAESMVAETISASDNLFARTTVDTGKKIEVDGLIVVGEGIIGDGVFQAKAAIANEYFEFAGDTNSTVFEVSEMDFVEASGIPIEQASNLEQKNNAGDAFDAAEAFNKAFNNSLNQWTEYEEDVLIQEMKKTLSNLDDLYLIDTIMDHIVSISYQREISNFMDLLYVLCAKNIFPNQLASYETIEPVLNQMYVDAIENIEQMEFSASNIEEFAYSLFILSKYGTQLTISIEDGADKIFSSIGLRYSTVERAWR